MKLLFWPPRPARFGALLHRCALCIPSFGIRSFGIRSFGICSFVICSLALSTSPAQAQVYIYVDEQGRKHFSDRPQADARLYAPRTQPQSVPEPQLPKLYSTSTHSAAGKKSANKQAKKKQHSKQQRSQPQQASKQAQRCAGLEQKIARLDLKLRRSHSNEQGNRWRAQRRDYSDQHWKLCRR